MKILGIVVTRATAAPTHLGLTDVIMNSRLFMTYRVLGHRITGPGVGAGVRRLVAAMVAAFVLRMPIGCKRLPYSTGLALILAGIGVEVSSSSIFYICNQIAMSRL